MYPLQFLMYNPDGSSGMHIMHFIMLIVRVLHTKANKSLYIMHEYGKIYAYYASVALALWPGECQPGTRTKFPAGGSGGGYPQKYPKNEKSLLRRCNRNLGEGL